MSFELQLVRPARFDVLSVGEDLASGQRGSAWGFEAWNGSRWIELAHGTTIGQRQLVAGPPTVTDRVRLRIDDALDPPTLGELRS